MPLDGDGEKVQTVRMTAVGERQRGAVPDLGEWVSSRRRYVDNLKVLLIAAIIAAHGLASYAAVEVWSYADVRETTLSPVTEGALFSVLAPFGLFLIPMLFLIAGLLTPGSLRRKGPGRFARDRLLRLGAPFVAFVGLVWPVLLYALYRPLGNAPRSYWAEFVGTAEESMDTGYLWFIGDLLLFSLGYAAWVAWRNRRGGAGGPRIGLRHLLILAAAVATATFVVRIWFTFESEYFIDLNIYEWPAALALFGLGIVAWRDGWLDAVSDRLHRQSRAVTFVAAGAFVVFVAAGFAMGGVDQETWAGGLRWEALTFATLESTLAVFGPIWLLSVAHRRLDRNAWWAGPGVRRSAYGAFVVQGLLLIGLAIALRPVPVPAEVKALVVAAGSVVGSFALAWLLIRRVPGVSRFL